MSEPALYSPKDGLTATILATASRLARYRIDAETAVASAIDLLPYRWTTAATTFVPRAGLLPEDVAPALVHHLSLPQVWDICGPIATERWDERKAEADEMVADAHEHDDTPIGPVRWYGWRLTHLSVPGLIHSLRGDTRALFHDYDHLGGYGVVAEVAATTLRNRLETLLDGLPPDPTLPDLQHPFLASWPALEANLEHNIPLHILLASTIAPENRRHALLRGLLGVADPLPEESPEGLGGIPLDNARTRAHEWLVVIRLLDRGKPLGRGRMADIEQLGGMAQFRLLLDWR